MRFHYTAAQILAGLDGFSPFPAFEDRAAWDALCPDARTEYISEAERLLDYEWPALKAELYLLAAQTGELRPGYVSFCRRRYALGILTIAECMEGKGRFLPQIINGIFSICEETNWAQNIGNKFLPDKTDHFVDLCSSETAQSLAFTLYLLGRQLDAVSGEVRARIMAELNCRIIRPYLDRTDYWWMGYTKDRINNWNPWCNLNMLYVCVFTDFPEKQGVLARILDSLSIYTDTYSSDGACDEGPMYWHAAGCKLGICAAWLSGFAGELPDAEMMARLKLIGAYYYKAHIAGQYFVDYADGDALASVPPTAFLFGQFIRDDNLIRLGASAKRPKLDSETWFPFIEHLLGLFDAPARAASGGGEPHIRDAYFSRCEILAARENEGSSHGFFLSAKGGHNAESHNHNDIGNFIVYLDGKPLIIDLGTEEYTSKTFSPRRYELWYLQSRYHNCPEIGGISQQNGAAFRSRSADYQADDYRAGLTLDIAPAYPAEAGVRRWNRSVELRRGGPASVVVTDSFELAEPMICAYSFMLACEPVLSEGCVRLGAEAELIYDNGALCAETEEILLKDARLRQNWGERVWRVLLRGRTPSEAAAHEFTIRRAGHA